ncbi:hypothetical protein SISSUDRAFT_738797 [Sistotremastrum suecicum HHB10207 ss-3]|uniref:Uncharacterized protein n=1 Tax=Sistotremastrum suecicum HHB10207 ss-3 TaxID=1314776 RepID=A0A166HV12_9AGAM|nr:hypothetical protein SISSUDRAFT_738797 [Sistotremastrum suecicum HHB10207 ss-3]
MFQFTFSIPSLRNPFATSTPSSSPKIHAPTPLLPHRVPHLAHTLVRHPSQFRLSPSPVGVAPEGQLSRKRGWEPSYTPSAVSTAAVTTGGYLDTPAKYRDFAMTEEHDQVIDALIDDLRPAKKRRTVTESVVATAFSAALISTAVGLTVYRMWRDRGKATDSPRPECKSPPPPYEEQWHQQRVLPSTPQPAPERTSVSQHNRPLRHRKSNVPRTSRVARKQLSHKPSVDHSWPLDPPEGSANEAGNSEHELDRQIDWMGAKLSALIEQGRRALNTEVVVLSEAKEDEVDDGTGNWVEEGQAPVPASITSMTSSTKSPRLFGTSVATSVPRHRSHSPSKSVAASPKTRSRAHSRASAGGKRSAVGLSPGPQAGKGEVEVLFESGPSTSDDLSPHIREAMARARAVRSLGR